VVQDADSELIVQVLTMPGNVPDGVVLPTLAQPQAQELTRPMAAKPIDPTWRPWA
jgi:hypothetical protein